VQVAGIPFYAREDGVVKPPSNRGHRTMELELIEPAPFLTSHTAAPDRLADAINAALHPGMSVQQLRLGQIPLILPRFICNPPAGEGDRGRPRYIDGFSLVFRFG
jgi:hypothetical protein